MIKIIWLLLLLIFILFLFTKIKIFVNVSKNGCVGLIIFALLLFLLGMALIYITEKLVFHFLVWLG